MQDKIITIDGSAGVGKGALGKILQEQYQFAFLDSGSLYRIVAFYALQNNIDSENEAKIATITTSLNIKFVDNKIYLNDNEISAEIRREEVGNAASKIAKLPQVRANLLQMQKDFYNPEIGLIADGRDMGTVVFPKARVKLFLTAKAEVRAKRRLLQLGFSENDKDEYHKILTAINERDEQDKNRTISPLIPALDALIIETSDLTLQDVINKATNYINEKFQ